MTAVWEGYVLGNNNNSNNTNSFTVTSNKQFYSNGLNQHSKQEHPQSFYEDQPQQQQQQQGRIGLFRHLEKTLGRLQMIVSNYIWSPYHQIGSQY